MGLRMKSTAHPVSTPPNERSASRRARGWVVVPPARSTHAADAGVISREKIAVQHMRLVRLYY